MAYLEHGTKMEIFAKLSSPISSLEERKFHFGGRIPTTSTILSHNMLQVVVGNAQITLQGLNSNEKFQYSKLWLPCQFWSTSTSPTKDH